MKLKEELIKKYNIAGPRYTSYPTVPFWKNDEFSKDIWRDSLITFGKEEISKNGLSIYIHLPYCESLCTFCACHKRITKNHSVEDSYIDALLAEWQMYIHLLDFKPLIKEIHLGGGTPSFFSSQNLKRLIDGILESSEVFSEKVFSFEGHPNNTTQQHLQTLYDVGFRRVSFGVQDYDQVVQKAIHREQSFESVQNVTKWAREIGYTSISHDLVFGLPFQQKTSIIDTISKTLLLKPERIAFYSYAHVPWIKGVGQRGFDEADLPSAALKRELYDTGLEMFENAGYSEVGMDHFALPGDELFEAMQNSTLHRNFMGYTTQTAKAMIGLGASSISDLWGAFGQNNKDVEKYKEIVFSGQFPIEKGHLLSGQDLFVRRQILNIMCNMKTEWSEDSGKWIDLERVISELKPMEADGLLELSSNGFLVKERALVRNIAMVFDQYLDRNNIGEKMFSKTI